MLSDLHKTLIAVIEVSIKPRFQVPWERDELGWHAKRTWLPRDVRVTMLVSRDWTTMLGLFFSCWKTWPSITSVNTVGWLTKLRQSILSVSNHNSVRILIFAREMVERFHRHFAEPLQDVHWLFALTPGIGATTKQQKTKTDVSTRFWDK